eukprot:CAMPEP_0202693906 /NCGR_PEP_ID=MMETSP1385-20130828/7909_1 /ASSEMBLY_ACC=CAM_ASM_000861 /TAXON_ID=933848 /ORGANISM="Elphidium margaritaceum" /LENGTH=122 /DNA_ID=CAMNT_0049349661 /DNA_START=228 /DNA_END=593 /DNA_ORIENTATION=+
MISAFSDLSRNGGNPNDDDSDDDNDGDECSNMRENEEQLRREYEAMIDPMKLKKKFVTYHSFKILGYNDAEIPPFEGDEEIGEQAMTKKQMVECMMHAKRMMTRDPELKHEMNKKITAYKQR